MLREHGLVRLSQNTGLPIDVNIEWNAKHEAAICSLKCSTPAYLVMIGCAIRQAEPHLRVDVRFGAAKSRPRHTSNPKHAYAKRLRFEQGREGSPVHVRQAAWDTIELVKGLFTSLASSRTQATLSAANSDVAVAPTL
jgi:hypothetical protein